MKKRLFLLLVIPFLISASPLQQKHLAVIAALNSTGESCTTSSDEKLRFFDAADGTYSITSDPGYVAQEIAPSGTLTITGYFITVRDDSQTGNVIVRLETDDGGSPSFPTGSVVSGSSVSMAHGSIDDSTPTEYWFELSSPIEISSGTYWIVVTNSTGMDFTVARHDTTASGFTEEYAYDNGGGYSISTKTLEFELWGCGTY